MFTDLLDEIKGFKYQVTVKASLWKYKGNGDIEFAPVILILLLKQWLILNIYLINLFNKIYIDWINEWSGWMIESINVEYVNISIYSPLPRSTCFKLPCKLKNSIKGLINIKNKNNKCFLCCHIRHLNLLKIHPERIKKADKNMVNDLDYKGIEFPVSKKDYSRIEQKIIFVLMYFVMKIVWLILCIELKILKICMDLFLITNKNKTH